MRYSLTFQLCFQYICVYLPKGTQTIKPKFDLLHFLIKAQSYFGGERVVMMTSELWDAVGQSERVVASRYLCRSSRRPEGEAGVLAGTGRTCSGG